MLLLDRYQVSRTKDLFCPVLLLREKHEDLGTYSALSGSSVDQTEVLQIHSVRETKKADLPAAIGMPIML